MSPTKDIHSKTNPGPDKTAADKDRRSHQPRLDSIDELQDFYDYSPVGYLTLDRNGRILTTNQTSITIMKTARVETIGQSFYDHIHRDDRDTLYFFLRNLFKNKPPRNCELRIQNADEKLIPVVLEGALAEDRKGRLVCRSVMIDNTQRKRMEEDLRRSRDDMEVRVQERTAELEKLNEKLSKEIEKRKKFEVDLIQKGERILQEQNRRKYLSKKLIETLERDRHEMAATLHDEVGQILTTINMDLDFVKQLASEHADTAVDEIEKVQDRIGKSMDYISDLSRDLRSNILDDLGLVPSLKSMFRNIKERSHIACHLFTKDIPKQISDKEAVAVYRIVQEAVRNCLRHAQAKNIFVNLTKRGHFLLLTIEDDGIGFEYDNITVEKGGGDKLGIMIMNERAVQAGGEFHIESRPGNGTQVIAEIPIE